LDSFTQAHRAQYFATDASGRTFIETAIKYGLSSKNSSNSLQQDMFEHSSDAKMPEPVFPKCEEWPSIYKLNKEKEVVGIFISGHPLDDFRIEIESFCNGNVGMLNDLETYKGRDLLIAAIVTVSEHRFTKYGDGFGSLTIEDYNDSFRLNLFKENYLRYKHFMEPGTFIAIKGRVEVPRHRTHHEFTINSIELLNDLREKKTKNLQLKVSSKALDQLMIDKLNNLLSGNEGSCPIQFTIFDTLEGIEINMPSRSIRVKPNNELFKELAKLDIEFRLN
jgi:DNA polymerase-3 subunit alpha